MDTNKLQRLQAIVSEASKLSSRLDALTQAIVQTSDTVSWTDWNTKTPRLDDQLLREVITAGVKCLIAKAEEETNRLFDTVSIGE